MKTSTVVFDMHGIIYEHNYALVKQNTHDQWASYVEIPGAMSTLLNYYHLAYKIVIISTSATEHSRQVLEKFLLNYPDIDQEQFFKKIDILSMKYFGHKDDINSWVEALRMYNNIEHIYEDGESHLRTAGQAAEQLGHHPELHQTIV